MTVDREQKRALLCGAEIQAGEFFALKRKGNLLLVQRDCLNPWHCFWLASVEPRVHGALDDCIGPEREAEDAGAV